MILGPLGFKTNEWHIHDGRYVLTSAHQQDFEWKEPLVWADCPRCPKDSEGHVIIQKGCTCGIYASVLVRDIREYIHSSSNIIALVEAMDSNLNGSNPNYSKGEHIWLHEDTTPVWAAGFTAPGALLVYLVDTTKHHQSPFQQLEKTGSHVVTPQTLAIIALAQAFHVDVISLDDAEELCKMQWERFGMEWRK